VAGLLAAASMSACLLPGCSLSRNALSINPPLQLADAMPHPAGARSPVPRPALLLDVPFHPQTDHDCGPAALATVLGASGLAISPATLLPQVYLPGRKGSLQLELVGASRRAGRIPYRVERTPEALFAELQAGRPVLVLQNLLVRTMPKWHYAVLAGTDPARNLMILNSGKRRAHPVTAPSFLRTWDWAERWAIVTLRPGELPAHADADTYFVAVSDFEAVAGAKAALPAWRAALGQWPRDARPHLAVGNHAYAAGDRVAAAQHYRDGLALAPTDPILGNNYASVLGELGCRTQAQRALAVARTELDADSPWRARLDGTELELASRDDRAGAACARWR
jgi:hypothetical protein